ncbi:MAG TPA: sensor histidine kinase [Arachidicoccus sp.]|nr:sensor histidine kinase [Arachidicoccus sp.]
MKVSASNCKWLIKVGILLLTAIQVSGQTKAIDSLQQMLTSAGMADTARINILLSLGDKMAYYNSSLSTLYLKKAFKLAAKRQISYKMGTAMAYLGSNYYYKDNNDSAQYYFDRSIFYFDKDTSIASRVSKATVQSEIADVEVGRGNFEAGIKVYLRVIDTLIHYDPGNHNTIGNLYLAISSVYRQLGQNDKALPYSKAGVTELSKDVQKPAAAAFGKLFLVSNLTTLKRFQEAEDILKEVQRTADRLKSDKLFSALYGNFGGYYDKIGERDKAISAYKEAIRYAIVTSDKFNQISALTQIGLIYADTPKTDYSKSALYLKKALGLIQVTGDKHKASSLLRHLAFVETKLRHPNIAVQYYRDYLALADSLNEADVKIKINEIESRYQSRQKSDSLLVLRKDAQFNQLELHKKESFNIGLIIGCGLLLLLVAATYMNIKRKSQLLKQAGQLHAQQILELEKQQQLVAMGSIIQGQETERSRLAKDLHDGVGGLLSGVKLSLSTMKGNVVLTAENARAVGNVIDQLDQSIAELRRVSHNMMPEALIKFGLKETLENYCENINISSPLNIRLQCFGMENRMEQNTEIVVYRIVQELLSNIIKHAHALHVLIQLLRKGDRFSLTVEDDGQGFESAAVDKKGAGLSNVQARAQYLNGTVDIHSAPGQGTSVTIEGSCT